MRRTVSPFVLALAACSSPGGIASTLFENRPDVGKLSLAVTLPSPARDVAEFTITIHAAEDTCADPPLETVNLASATTGVSDAGIDQTSANGIVALVEGPYRVCAQPLMSNGAPSEHCAPTEELLRVIGGTTVGVALVSECRAIGVGGVELQARTNSPPHVHDVSVVPSTRVDTCTSVRLEGVIEDPDGDAVSASWTVAAGPPSADFTLTSENASATFTAATPGEYTVVLTASDPLASSTSFTVPLTFDPADSDCATGQSVTFPDPSTEEDQGNEPSQAVDAGTSSEANSSPSTEEDAGFTAPIEVLSSGIRLTAGNGHTCRLDQGNGSVVCWGLNEDGQSSPPNGVNASFSSVDSGGYHTCGVSLSSHLVQCWGRDSSNQSSPPAIQVDQISAGNTSTCAIRSDNKNVVCWGSDDNNRLDAPEELAFRSVSVGHDHTCGIRLESGLAVCWGRDFHSGVLSPPPEVQFESLSAGREHTCAIRSDNHQIECWGRETQGQLDSPVGIEFAEVTAGFEFACAIQRESRTVTCWGDDTNGRLDAPDATKFEHLYAGDDHTCGVTLDGSIECWGFNTAEGQSSAAPTGL